MKTSKLELSSSAIRASHFSLASLETLCARRGSSSLYAIAQSFDDIAFPRPDLPDREAAHYGGNSGEARKAHVIQKVREKFACRECEKISQPLAPFHVTPRGMFEPSFLAMVLFEKFGSHQHLNWQRDRYALDAADPGLSTLADQGGVYDVFGRSFFLRAGLKI